RDHLDLQVHQLRSNIRDMEVFQHGQRDEITRPETEISSLTHAIGNDPENLHTQVLQLRTERNDFERQTISAHEDLHYTESDRDRLRLEAIQAGDEIRDLQAQIRGLERKTDDAKSESATALASYNRISSSLALTQPDHGRDLSSRSSARLAQTHRDSALADLVLAQATLTQVSSDRDRAFKQLAQTTEDRDRALVDRDSAPASAILDDDLEVVRQELREREGQMTDLQVAHDQLAVLRDLAESDLNEADILLTHLASRIRTPRSDRPVSPPPNQDQSEIEGPEGQEHPDQSEIEGPEGQEHQDQPEFEGPDDQELEDKREIPSGGGGSPGDHDSPPPDRSPATPPPSPSQGYGPTTPPPSPPRLFTATDTNPWDPTVVGTVPIIAMIQATLTKRMPIPANFLFPYRVPPVRAPIPVVGYCSELITAQTPLWRIAVSYAALEEDRMIAYWESTHYLEITSVMAAADSDRFTYHQDRRVTMHPEIQVASAAALTGEPELEYGTGSLTNGHPELWKYIPNDQWTSRMVEIQPEYRLQPEWIKCNLN
ncbi:hypothetical protein PHMEG_00031975, partial [Phytophthora megakarya]